jgi:hypothetical protein
MRLTVNEQESPGTNHAELKREVERLRLAASPNIGGDQEDLYGVAREILSLRKSLHEARDERNVALGDLQAARSLLYDIGDVCRKTSDRVDDPTSKLEPLRAVRILAQHLKDLSNRPRTMSAGNASHLRNEIREALETATKRHKTAVPVEDAYFHRGKVEAYTYALSRLESMLNWLGMPLDSVPTLKGES